MLKDLIKRIDRFITETVNSHKVSLEEKARMARELLREAESIFGRLSVQQQSLLEPKIIYLRKKLDSWARWLKSGVEDQLARYRRAYERLAQKPHPTPEDRAEMERIKAEMRRLRQQLPGILGEEGREPALNEAPLRQATSFRTKMEKRVLADEPSLRDAITQAQAQIRRLQAYRSNLDFSTHALSGKQAWDEIRAISALIREWQNQIDQLKHQEGLARTWRWQQDKSAEQTRRYVTSKQSSLEKGQAQIDAIKTLREAKTELEGAFSICQMIVSKSVVQQMPESIPMDEVATIIQNFEGILNSLKDRLPEAEVRDAINELNRIKAYEVQMRQTLKRLGYGKEVSSYEETRESEGLSYFRANVPEAVRDILSKTTLSKLESLASTGVNGAKEAITRAIFMAAKANPERMKIVLGG